MKLVTTHFRSCARMGLGSLLSTLALVSAAVVILPDSCDAAVVDGAVVSAEASDAPASSQWNVEPLLQDPADSPDEDDDDPDAQQDASSAVAARRGFAAGIDSSWRIALADAASMASRTLEGHYLRGPPPVDQEPCDFDDDSDDSSLEHPSTAPGPLVRVSLVTLSELECVRARAPDGARLRAP